MQVILKSDVDHLGYSNDVVDVKRGYWRNYLRPRGLAETATAERMRELAEAMERRRSVEARNSGEAEELKTLIDRTSIEIPALATPEGTLFGSVSGPEISRVLEATRKLRLDPRNVALDAPLKAVGTYQVPVDLGHGVKAELTVEIVESKLSAEELARIEAEQRAVAAAEEAAQLKAEAKAKADAATARGEGAEPTGDDEGDDAPATEGDTGTDAEGGADADADADVSAADTADAQA